MGKTMKKITIVKSVTFTAALMTSALSFAWPGGVIGKSGNPEQGTYNTCFGCHKKWDEAVGAPFTALTSIVGPQNLTVRAGSFSDIKVLLETDAFWAGFNISKTAGTFIDLEEAQDEYTKIKSPGETVNAEEATHNARTPVVDGKVTWTTRWQAPEQEGLTTFYTCVNPVSNDQDGKLGDGAAIENACISQEITVISAGENETPVTANDILETNQNTSQTINVIANDSDDIQLLASTVSVEMAPANGSAEVNPKTGEITYNPYIGFSGIDSFTYTVADGEGLRSEPAQVDLTIILTSGAPIIFNSEYNTFTDNVLTIDLLSAVNENSAVTFTEENIEITRVNNGTTTIEANGSISYVANKSFKGIDSFTYVINAEDGAVSNEATVFITVTEKLSSDGGSFSFSMLALLALVSFKRRKTLVTSN